MDVEYVPATRPQIAREKVFHVYGPLILRRLARASIQIAACLKFAVDRGGGSVGHKCGGSFGPALERTIQQADQKPSIYALHRAPLSDSIGLLEAQFDKVCRGSLGHCRY